LDAVDDGPVEVALGGLHLDLDGDRDGGPHVVAPMDLRPAPADLRGEVVVVPVNDRGLGDDPVRAAEALAAAAGVPDLLAGAPEHADHVPAAEGLRVVHPQVQE
ncbi:MAG: hypothetical protein ACK559_17165, partial [bacterium]